MQSAYWKYHSTETALLRVHNDILRALDCHRNVMLVLLDLSAAFDTVEHHILLRRLRDRYGVRGVRYGVRGVHFSGSKATSLIASNMLLLVIGILLIMSSTVEFRRGR